MRTMKRKVKRKRMMKRKMAHQAADAVETNSSDWSHRAKHKPIENMT
jgi:hypothetical protein